MLYLKVHETRSQAHPAGDQDDKIIMTRKQKAESKIHEAEQAPKKSCYPSSFWLVCFHLFVVPAIRRLSGWTDPHPLRVFARLVNPVKADSTRPDFHRAIVKWKENDGSSSSGFVAESTGQQMSSRLLSMRAANALLELPPTGNVIVAGTPVSAVTTSHMRATCLVALEST